MYLLFGLVLCQSLAMLILLVLIYKQLQHMEYAVKVNPNGMSSKAITNNALGTAEELHHGNARGETSADAAAAATLIPTINHRAVQRATPASLLATTRAIESTALTTVNKNTWALNNSGKPLARRFEPRSIKPGHNMIIVGKRGCGKTILYADLIRCIHETHGIHVQSSLFLYDTPMNKESLEETARALQLDICVKNSNEVDAPELEQRIRRGNGHTLILAYHAVFSDDNNKDRRQNDVMNIVHLNAPHMKHKCFFIYVAEYLPSIPHTVRNGFDYSFLFRDVSTSNRNKLFDHYGGFFGEDRESFNDTYDMLTTDHSAMVLDIAGSYKSAYVHHV